MPVNSKRACAPPVHQHRGVDPNRWTTKRQVIETGEALRRLVVRGPQALVICRPLDYPQQPLTRKEPTTPESVVGPNNNSVLAFGLPPSPARNQVLR